PGVYRTRPGHSNNGPGGPKKRNAPHPWRFPPWMERVRIRRTDDRAGQGPTRTVGESLPATAAAATAAAATTATAAAAAAAATTAAALAILRPVDAQGTRVEVLAVELGNGRLGCVRGAHGHEAEAARAAGITV